MGYSYSAKAGHAFDCLINRLQKDGGDNPKESNTWTIKGVKHFWDRGKEQADGAMTGTVHRFVGENHCRLMGHFRVEPDGTITRFPTSKANQRKESTVAGLAVFAKTYRSVQFV